MPIFSPSSMGCSVKYAARYGDYFSKMLRSSSPEWYLVPQGLFIVTGRDGKIMPPGRTNPSTNAPQKSNASGRTKACVSEACRARGAGAGRREVLAGYSQIYLTTGFASRKRYGSILARGYQPQFDLSRSEEYSQPRLMVGCVSPPKLVREALK